MGKLPVKLRERGFATNPAAAKATCVEAGEAAVQGWFEGAGMAQVAISSETVEVTLPPFEAYVANHIRALPPVVVGNFCQADEVVRERAFSEIREVLAPYQTTRGYKVPFTSFVASAQL